ncbi:MAG: hypothetical protein H6832_16160 [Planctomycetes bacterium]|nr:hypothetical protein [Planctomycetota bacterium]
MMQSVWIGAFMTLSVGPFGASHGAGTTTGEAFGSVSVTSARWVGGDDADVCTKKNRTTHYTVSVQQLQLDRAKQRITGIVIYTVREGKTNHTRLRGTRPFSIPAPAGAIAILERQPEVSGSLRGKNHSWNDVDPANTYFSDLEIRVDGSGDDDEGNAAMTGKLAIPVQLAAKD